MKIAYSSMNGKTISGHPGRAKYLVIVEIDKDKIVNKEVIDNPLNHHKEEPKGKILHEDNHYHHHQHSQRFDFLTENGIEAFITKRCGEGFKRNLAKRNIKLIITDKKEIEDVLDALSVS
jgi:predicted Fe-Mo cluster-binding NifX family protein